jgi:thiol-disulfide isomerase/thioredoxin
LQLLIHSDMKNLLFTGAALLFLAASCSNNKTEQSTSAQQQNNIDSNTASGVVTVPSFSLQDVNGNVINLQSLRGKKLFVNIWASWCPPCKRELPSIEKLYKSVDTSRSRFLLVSFDDKFESAMKYISSKKINLPIYYPTENPPALFQVQGIPATFIFNENGDLVKRVDGGENYDTKEYKDLFH